MAEPIIPQSSTFELVPPSNSGPPHLSARQALVIGARACEHLLTGQPDAATFEPSDLELAAALLRHLALLVASGGRA